MTDKLSIGSVCSYYWQGWRVGTIIAIPIKGQHKGDVRIEQPPLLCNMPDRLPVRVWVPEYDVNELGDTFYHGPKLEQMVREREEAKATQQYKADKMREKARRFHK